MNKIKEWFLDNNIELQVNYDERLMNILLMYTKTFFIVNKNMNVNYDIYMTTSGIRIDDKEDINELTEKQMFTLNVVNKMYGYVNTETQLNILYNDSPFINHIEEYDEEDVLIEDYELDISFGLIVRNLENSYYKYDFNENIIKINNVYMFYDKDIILADEEIHELELENYDNTRTYELYRDEKGNLHYE